MTPFMLQIAETLDAASGTPGVQPPAVHESSPEPAPLGADRQVALRALAEQLVAEANAVLHPRGDVVELDDQLVDGQLGFRMSYGPRCAVVRTTFAGGTATGELVGVGATSGHPVELDGPDELARLILLLVSPSHETFR